MASFGKKNGEFGELEFSELRDFCYGLEDAIALKS
jgi:hypothetical protein